MKNQRILSGNQSVEELEQMFLEQTDYLRSCLNKLSQSEVCQFRRDSDYCYTTLDSIYKTERRIREIDDLNIDDIKSSKTKNYIVGGISLLVLIVLFLRNSDGISYLILFVVISLYTIDVNQRVNIKVVERYTRLTSLQSTFTILTRDFVSLFGTSFSLENMLGLNLVKEQEEVKVSTEYDKELYDKIEVIQRIMSNELKLSLISRIHNFGDDKEFTRYEHMSYRIVDLEGYYNL